MNLPTDEPRTSVPEHGKLVRANGKVQPDLRSGCTGKCCQDKVKCRGAMLALRLVRLSGCSLATQAVPPPGGAGPADCASTGVPAAGGDAVRCQQARLACGVRVHPVAAPAEGSSEHCSRAPPLGCVRGPRCEAGELRLVPCPVILLLSRPHTCPPTTFGSRRGVVRRGAKLPAKVCLVRP